MFLWKTQIKTKIKVHLLFLILKQKYKTLLSFDNKDSEGNELTFLHSYHLVPTPTLWKHYMNINLFLNNPGYLQVSGRYFILKTHIKWTSLNAAEAPLVLLQLLNQGWAYHSRRRKQPFSALYLHLRGNSEVLSAGMGKDNVCTHRPSSVLFCFSMLIITRMILLHLFICHCFAKWFVFKCCMYVFVMLLLCIFHEQMWYSTGILTAAWQGLSTKPYYSEARRQCIAS